MTTTISRLNSQMKSERLCMISKLLALKTVTSASWQATPTTGTTRRPRCFMNWMAQTIELRVRAATGGGIGAAAGGAAGLLAGLGLIAIPGVGPVVAAGWLVATLTGALAGGATGGMIGALTQHAGLSKEDADLYAEGLRRGGAVVSARVGDTDAARYQAVMDRSSVKASDRADAYRKSGWTQYNSMCAAIFRR